ncbi:uncharacterized protein BJ212DRAFT_921766 [Suillus subaureus]|uniref:Uncharacterized protein n=1 Tax=Suillus subaureus TaxID=48587 RepID=A0A9P7EIM1_9AGAM|nr:uncharacterized protein BJ212DRAFT_921766 [Suillus subaureus]KAG1821795.1 hypothetical protein BJ212DRAFT_921766 [Suillus subaureus]
MKFTALVVGLPQLPPIDLSQYDPPQPSQEPLQGHAWSSNGYPAGCCTHGSNIPGPYYSRHRNPRQRVRLVRILRGPLRSFKHCCKIIHPSMDIMLACQARITPTRHPPKGTIFSCRRDLVGTPNRSHLPLHSTGQRLLILTSTKPASLLKSRLVVRIRLSHTSAGARRTRKSETGSLVSTR